MTSPTWQSTIYKDSDSDIDVEVEATPAIAGGLDFVDEDGNTNNGVDVKVETLGMTNERQQQIQDSLFRMLGHDVNENGNAESDSRNRGH